MDPSLLRRLLLPDGLPRACGDGPHVDSMVTTTERAPPRLRGWTRARPIPGGQAEGSPALAGMDRSRASGRSFPLRLPRACGDGPQAGGRTRRMMRAPPRLRGWTPRRDREERQSRGSPALAGMDPASRSSAWTRSGLPRACGDGPQLGRDPRASPVAPPRLRGWTRVGVARAGGGGGSPALAGMDPSGRSGKATNTWLPRACGDGPVADFGFHRWARLPRACGDGPSTCWPKVESIMAPPRLRGWTRVPRPRRHRDRGSPALAGMDPSA